MVELREHPGRRVALITAGFIAAGLITWFLFRFQDQDVVAAECRRLYRDARTALDTAVVDQQRPIVTRAQASTAASCGLLRKTGRL